MCELKCEIQQFWAQQRKTPIVFFVFIQATKEINLICVIIATQS